MSNKHIALFLGGAALVLFGIYHFAQQPAAGGPAGAPSADASINGPSPQGAAQGTTNANGDPYNGLGTTG